ncbi:MAG: hypothetical protein GYB20_17635 [Oceanospirillales bacterium]|nr:hypothetical protein [Oceanospirillales bacterium]MBR9889503.1 hypothetical protein [Oceanospirillales bacterium]
MTVISVVTFIQIAITAIPAINSQGITDLKNIVQTRTSDPTRTEFTPGDTKATLLNRNTNTIQSMAFSNGESSTVIIDAMTIEAFAITGTIVTGSHDCSDHE